MYRILVQECGGRQLLGADCRISALSAADYCLGRREKQGIPAWKGHLWQIRRLFQAERLAGDMSGLKPWKIYTVVFLKYGREVTAESA